MTPRLPLPERRSCGGCSKPQLPERSSHGLPRGRRMPSLLAMTSVPVGAGEELTRVKSSQSAAQAHDAVGRHCRSGAHAEDVESRRCWRKTHTNCRGRWRSSLLAMTPAAAGAGAELTLAECSSCCQRQWPPLPEWHSRAGR
jgi:hypothetical protein